MSAFRGPGAPTHICPGGCGITSVPYARLACRACWYKLPIHLRDMINATYELRGNAEGRRAHALAVADARRWYRNRLPQVVDTTGDADE